MGFRIESVNSMKQIASDLTNTASNTTTRLTQTTNTFTNLATMVSGGGVEEALSKCNEAISSYTQRMIELLNKVSEFINNQVSSYTLNEEETSSSLDEIDQVLESIKEV